MDLQLSGRVALVTGASRGIGRAIAVRLATEGVEVVAVARSREQLQALEGELAPRRVLGHAADLTDPAAVEAAVATAVRQFGRLDILVNNAGATKRGDFLALTDADWADGFALKFFGYMRMARAAWPHLQAAGGQIVNIIGVGGRGGSREFTIGGAVNAALANLTKALADRGIADGIRVNAINPGSVETERLAQRIARFAAEHDVPRQVAVEQMLSEHDIARFGRPEDVATLVAFVASPLLEFLQGSIIDLDGGQTRAI